MDHPVLLIQNNVVSYLNRIFNIQFMVFAVIGHLSNFDHRCVYQCSQHFHQEIIFVARGNALFWISAIRLFSFHPRLKIYHIR